MKRMMVFASLVLLLMACTNKDVDQPVHVPEKGISGQKEKKQGAQEIVLPDTPLQKGDTSDGVHDLQHVLKEIGYPVKTTGIFDDLTTWALTDIQLQDGDILATGLYDAATMEIIADIRAGDQTMKVGMAIDEPEHPDSYPTIIENPYDILAVVNKRSALPGDYVPDDLVVPDIRFPFTEDDPKKQLRQVAASAIEELFAAGDEAGVTLFGQSGYRSYDRQEAVFAAYVGNHGEEQANTFSAKPGESEHQTGLVMDVTSEAIGFGINDDFGATDEGIWLKDHAHEYGFIIRYPEDKVDITKYQFEPWHIRYVGKKAASDIYQNGETLEEYFGVE